MYGDRPTHFQWELLCAKGSYGLSNVWDLHDAKQVLSKDLWKWSTDAVVEVDCGAGDVIFVSPHLLRRWKANMGKKTKTHFLPPTGRVAELVQSDILALVKVKRG